jgi:hypothetical protein
MLVQGQVGDAFWFRVYSSHTTQVYLPVVMRVFDTRPDLVITAVTIDPAQPDAAQIVIANQGLSTATEFWVDIFLDPDNPPEVNQSCVELGCVYQLVWFVDALPLARV